LHLKYIKYEHPQDEAPLFQKCVKRGNLIKIEKNFFQSNLQKCFELVTIISIKQASGDEMESIFYFCMTFVYYCRRFSILQCFASLKVLISKNTMQKWYWYNILDVHGSTKAPRI
jgi:hypothetical protein